MRFTGRSPRRRTVGASLSALAVLMCAGQVTAAATTAATPAKDTFVGGVTSATGKLAGDSGKITALFHVVQSTDAVRKLRITMIGAPCSGAQHCLRLSGLLSGTISAHPATVPDVGRHYELSLSGSLGTFSHVAAGGTVAGVGFIRQGHESLTLDVKTASGKIVIEAVSPKVPGFTSP